MTMSRAQALKVAESRLPEIEEAVGEPAANWGRRCHEVSLKVLRSGLFGPGRVARGTASGVTGQHSWIILGEDCYSPRSVVVDPTIWSYGTGKPAIHVVNNLVRHRPHGLGSIWDFGCPAPARGEKIPLAGHDSLSREARSFLGIAGYPLDRAGWTVLAHAPVQGWPAGEILGAMCDSGLGVLIPIDIVGMVTSRNPENLYW